MASELPRVVLDTNVCLALFAYADPACAALHAALLGQRLQAVANAGTRAEWLRVLQRDALNLDRDCRTLAAQAFDALVQLPDLHDAETAEVRPLPRCRDPDDQIFLELARDAGAVALYSRDRELLRLSRRTQRDAGFMVLRPEDY